MPDPLQNQASDDWSAATYEGNRRRQRLAAMALTLREKIKLMEEMEDVARHLAGKRAADPAKSDAQASPARRAERQ